MLQVDDVLITTNSSSALLGRAIHRYLDAIKEASPTSPLRNAAVAAAAAAAPSATLVVVVGSDSEDLDETTDAQYTLHVGTDGQAAAYAPSVFGAIHALESFSQLLEQRHNDNDDNNKGDSAGPEGTHASAAAGGSGSTSPLQLRGLPWTISDAPRFNHRGMLLDSSRHFLPVDAILAHIDAMAAVKLNLLHWHLVDFQSFPVQSNAAPGLGKAAYSNREQYTLDDLKQVVLYAKDRGVRVMPEIDTPGKQKQTTAYHPAPRAGSELPLCIPPFTLTRAPI